jgi:hypothetical protein
MSERPWSCPRCGGEDRRCSLCQVKAQAYAMDMHAWAHAQAGTNVGHGEFVLGGKHREAPERAMSEDRSKLPDGLMVQHKGWHTEHRPACYVVVDTRETSEAEVTEDAWALVDRIRAEERERIAALLERDGAAERLGLVVAAWLRAGAKGEP